MHGDRNKPPTHLYSILNSIVTATREILLTVGLS